MFNLIVIGHKYKVKVGTFKTKMDAFNFGKTMLAKRDKMNYYLYIEENEEVI